MHSPTFEIVSLSLPSIVLDLRVAGRYIGFLFLYIIVIIDLYFVHFKLVFTLRELVRKSNICAYFTHVAPIFLIVKCNFCILL